jgi:hypothetical protein
MKHVLRENWAKRKRVFIGKIIQSEGSRVRTSSICVKRNLAGTERISVPFGSVIGRLN